MNATLSEKNNSFFINQQLHVKKHGLLNVCSYTSFKPVIYNNGQGFEADLLRAIAKLWQVSIKFHPEEDYAILCSKPLQNDIDIAAGGLDPNIHSKTKLKTAFSTPTAAYSQSLLVRRKDVDSGKIINYDSFKSQDHTIGVLGNTTGEKFGHERAKEHNISLSIFKRYPSEEDLLNALMQGEIDAIARGSIGNDYQATIHTELVTIDKKDFGETFAFAIDPTNDELFSQINLSIKLITNQGKISYEEWFHDNQIFHQQVNNIFKRHHIKINN